MNEPENWVDDHTGGTTSELGLDVIGQMIHLLPHDVLLLVHPKAFERFKFCCDCNYITSQPFVGKDLGSRTDSKDGQRRRAFRLRDAVCNTRSCPQEREDRRDGSRAEISR